MRCLTVTAFVTQSWVSTLSTSTEDMHFYETKLSKHIRDFFEYALYKFNLIFIMQSVLIRVVWMLSVKWPTTLHLIHLFWLLIDQVWKLCRSVVHTWISKLPRVWNYTAPQQFPTTVVWGCFRRERDWHSEKSSKRVSINSSLNIVFVLFLHILWDRNLFDSFVTDIILNM